MDEPHPYQASMDAAQEAVASLPDIRRGLQAGMDCVALTAAHRIQLHLEVGS